MFMYWMQVYFNTEFACEREHRAAPYAGIPQLALALTSAGGLLPTRSGQEDHRATGAAHSAAGMKS